MLKKLLHRSFRYSNGWELCKIEPNSSYSTGNSYTTKEKKRLWIGISSLTPNEFTPLVFLGGGAPIRVSEERVKIFISDIL